MRFSNFICAWVWVMVPPAGMSRPLARLDRDEIVAEQARRCDLRDEIGRELDRGIECFICTIA